MQILFAVRRLIIFYMYIYNVHSTFKNNTKFTLHTSFVHATVIKSLVWVHDFRGFECNEHWCVCAKSIEYYVTVIPKIIICMINKQYEHVNRKRIQKYDFFWIVLKQNNTSTILPLWKHWMINNQSKLHNIYWSLIWIVGYNIANFERQLSKGTL